MDMKMYWYSPFQREAMLLCCFQSKPHDVGEGELDESKIKRAAATAATSANVATAVSTAEPATTSSATKTPAEQIGSNLNSKEQVVEQWTLKSLFVC